MINESDIINLFPTPIYKTKFYRKLTLIEKNILFSQKEKTIENVGNRRSVNSYILDLPMLSQFKKDIESEVNKFFQFVYKPKNDILLYITQSWINITEEKEHHHTHTHPNSLLSGIFYLQADSNNDNVSFSDPKKLYSSFTVEPYQHDNYTASSFMLPIETSDLILFQSSIPHKVESKVGKKTRISLSFNTFFKGSIGDEYSLTQLIL
jgi:uncharacterized protein (TIGR02466 family)